MAAAVASRQTVAPGPAVFIPMPPPAVSAADKTARPARRPSNETATPPPPAPERKATADRVKTTVPTVVEDGAAKAETKTRPARQGSAGCDAIPRAPAAGADARAMMAEINEAVDRPVIPLAQTTDLEAIKINAAATAAKVARLAKAPPVETDTAARQTRLPADARQTLAARSNRTTQAPTTQTPLKSAMRQPSSGKVVPINTSAKSPLSPARKSSREASPELRDLVISALVGTGADVEATINALAASSVALFRLVRADRLLERDDTFAHLSQDAGLPAIDARLIVAALHVSAKKNEDRKAKDKAASPKSGAVAAEAA